MNFLSGLLSKFGGGGADPGAGGGGLLGGLGGMLNGTPGSIVQRPDIAGPGGGMGPGVDGSPLQGGGGPIHQMPQVTVGQPGLLDRLKTPDTRGLTFGDKLFAAGGIAQGDSGGAMSYLQNQRSMQDAMNERDRQRDIASRGLEALKGAINPDGSINPRAYLGALPPGADVGEALGTASKLAPKTSFENMGQEGLYGLRQGPFGGPVDMQTLVGAQAAKAPKYMRHNPETGALEIDPLQIQAAGQVANVQGSARARYRAPRAGPGSFRPPGSTPLPQ